VSRLIGNKWTLIAFVALIWSVSSSLLAVYYFYQYTQVNERMKSDLAAVDIGLDYGNNTRVWFNNTQVLRGMTLFDATRRVANVSYSAGLAYGVVVESINSVNNSFPSFWIWWKRTDSSWTMGEIGADAYLLKQGETFLWYFEEASSWPPPKPR